jgi:flagellar biosynthesis chaperone FliJ
MTAFRYPFEFLMWKAQTEIETEARELANARQMVADKTQQALDVETALNRWESRISELLSNGKGITVDELLRFRQHVAFHRDRFLGCQAELAELTALETTIHNRLIAKKTELRIFEKHQNRMLMQHNQREKIAEDAREEALTIMRPLLPELRGYHDF